MTTTVMGGRIRDVLRDHGKLRINIDDLADESDLYEAGLSSHASVNLMLALEDEFGLEFPEAMLLRSTFSSIARLDAALQSIIALRTRE